MHGDGLDIVPCENRHWAAMQREVGPGLLEQVPSVRCCSEGTKKSFYWLSSLELLWLHETQLSESSIVHERIGRRLDRITLQDRGVELVACPLVCPSGAGKDEGADNEVIAALPARDGMAVLKRKPLIAEGLVEVASKVPNLPAGQAGVVARSVGVDKCPPRFRGRFLHFYVLGTWVCLFWVYWRRLLNPDR